MLACEGFIDALYVHMGFHPAWKFEHVEELIFEGKVDESEVGKLRPGMELLLTIVEQRGQ